MTQVQLVTDGGLADLSRSQFAEGEISYVLERTNGSTRKRVG